jgi:hypothetical protein
MKKLYIYILLTVFSVGYCGYSIWNMVFENLSPFTLKATALKLDKNKVYAISTSDKSNDTLTLNYPEAEAILPKSLGWVYYDDLQGGFVLKTSSDIFKADAEDVGSDMVLRPFALTLNDGFFKNSQFFGPNQIIKPQILLKNGVKFNSPVGDKQSRVWIKLMQASGEFYLKTNSEGLGVSYLVPSRGEQYESVFNLPTSTDTKYAFSFANVKSAKGREFISVQEVSTFDAKYIIKNEVGIIIKSDTYSKSPFFESNGILYELQRKYSPLIIVFSVFTYLMIVFFQFVFLKVYSEVENNKPFQSIIAIRLIINNIAFMATPIYLTSLYISQNRWVYLIAMLILNATVYIPVDIFHSNKSFFGKEWKKGYEWIGWGILMVLPFLMIIFTSNELLFGLIPVVHVQKIAILLFIFISQRSYLLNRLFNTKYKYWLRLIVVGAYAAALSFITHDLGSLIYTSFAFLIIEVIKKTISLKRVVIASITIIGLTVISYNFFWNNVSDRKAYRIVAPYTLPSSEKLAKAHEADRETYSSLILGLKNISLDSPKFNHLVIPADMRSVSFSDYSFYTSLQLGGIYFLLLFFANLVLLISEFLFLLFISIRAIRITETHSYLLAIHPESELVRFILAFHLVIFTYSVFSNLLILPITGQSIPGLAISNFEFLFLAIFFYPLTVIFTDNKYVLPRKDLYSYYDIRQSIKLVFTMLTILFTIAFSIRYLIIRNTPDTLSWQKVNVELDEFNEKSLKGFNFDKEKLNEQAAKIVGSDKLTKIAKLKKPTLKNLAALYYSGKTYDQAFSESNFFVNSTGKLKNRMSIDSVFSTDKRLISSSKSVYGDVYAFNQQINNKTKTQYSNSYYSSLMDNVQSLNPDLTAEISQKLERHLAEIGHSANIASVTIVENETGNVVANSSYPFYTVKNSNEVEYLVGSVKKVLPAYLALSINPEYYKIQRYGRKQRNFKDFIQWSDSEYAGELMRDLLKKHPEKVNQILRDDFDLPLSSLTQDSFFDNLIDENELTQPIQNTSIYRCSIGQQQPHNLLTMMKWYTRIATGKKIVLGFDQNKEFESLSIPEEELDYLQEAFHEVLNGTAKLVRIDLQKSKIDITGLICKTGTAQMTDSKDNSGSSFILCTPEYTIGIMIKGFIPDSRSHIELHSKGLFNSIIPILVKYQILISY